MTSLTTQVEAHLYGELSTTDTDKRFVEYAVGNALEAFGVTAEVFSIGEIRTRDGFVATAEGAVFIGNVTLTFSYKKGSTTLRHDGHRIRSAKQLLKIGRKADEAYDLSLYA